MLQAIVATAWLFGLVILTVAAMRVALRIVLTTSHFVGGFLGTLMSSLSAAPTREVDGIANAPNVTYLAAPRIQLPRDRVHDSRAAA